ncbi:hypothetical protein D7Y07_08675 [Bacteroides acidifaciens]|uniref:Uncharacterized protein n=1 Tax=Bacteroides acidifaciens TaxID=85831 RepID=A0A3L8A850_9BACE|nr:hypothetical protein D7Y07_08675 [Bacteroides acidifaciens]
MFFIVLDLRLTKVGARRCSFFYARTYPVFLIPPPKNSDAIRVGYRHYHSHIPSLCRPDSDAIFIHYFLVRKFTYLRPSHASKSANIPQSAFSIAALINGSIISYPSPVG